jgi:RNA polymerase sigma-70 factor (ECF subfamily)
VVPLRQTGRHREDVSALYAKYGFFLRRRCRTILRNDALADDALQEAFVKVLHSEGALAEVEEPLRWLYRVVDRCCFDALRKARRSIVSPGSEGDDEERSNVATVHPSVDHEVRDAVLRLLATLTEDEMQIALLLFVDGMSQGEIADELGLSRVTINKRVQGIRARADVWLDRPTSREAVS